MDKQSYIRDLVIGRGRWAADAAIIFWHAEVPLATARIYMQTLATKWED